MVIQYPCCFHMHGCHLKLHFHKSYQNLQKDLENCVTAKGLKCICPSIHALIHMSFSLFVHPSALLSIYLFICIFVLPPVFQSVYPSCCVYAHLSICLSVHLPIHPSILLSIYSYVPPCVSLHACLSVSIQL